MPENISKYGASMIDNLRPRLSPETMDGLEFEMRLASNPKVRARQAEFLARVKAFREKIASKTKAEMIAELKAHNPAYLLHLLETNSEAEIRSRYVMTFVHTDPTP
jgi:hypothetical protein